jgi:hypothetical protein
LNHPCAAQAGEAACDAARDVFAGAIEAVARVAPEDGFAAIKVTALGQPELLERWSSGLVETGAGKESDMPDFKGSDLGRLPLVSADFWTSDHLSERSRRVDAFSETHARGTLTLKRR